jgi:hypothetical protein
MRKDFVRGDRGQRRDKADTAGVMFKARISQRLSVSWRVRAVLHKAIYAALPLRKRQKSHRA